MVRVISTDGIPPGMMDGLDGWASSEFSSAAEELLETLSVEVPEIREPVQGVLVAQNEPVVEVNSSLRRPGAKKKVRSQDATSIRERILAAKRKSHG